VLAARPVLAALPPLLEAAVRDAVEQPLAVPRLRLEQQAFQPAQRLRIVPG
jgi:hypothetical protein